MAERTLTNYAEMEGTFGIIPFEDEKSTEVSVTLVELPFTKTADREVWFSGELTFTLTVSNSDNTESLPDVVISDTLDTTMFDYIPDSVVVMFDGVALTLGTDYTVDYTAPVLEVTFLVDIPAASVATISFRGKKVPPNPPE